MTHSWQWKTWGDRPYLTCSLLEPWSHGFFTQHFWPQLPENLVQALDHQALVHRVRQVHGNTVLSPMELQAPPSPSASEDTLHAADGLVSDGQAQSLWVCSADCVPALIGNVETGQVAAIHAGWRGTAARIVPQAIARLLKQGSQLKDLRIALGPAIAGDVYQVSKTVAAELAKSLAPTTEPRPAIALTDELETPPELIAEVLQPLEQLPNSPLYPDDHPNRVRVDVRRMNQLQLEQMGIHPEQIAIAPYCTYQSPEHFFSYRRTQKKQVQWSGIISRSA